LSRFAGPQPPLAVKAQWFLPASAYGRIDPTMNDDDPVGMLETLKAEHRQLDERIRLLSSEPTGDQLEIARLKRRKLQLKDHIQRIIDSSVPDIIA
jgi:hypothetical protein